MSNDAERTGGALESKYLWEEYKLLQDKLDKIGAFRFQVKSWLVALVTAFVVSGYAAKLPWWAYASGFLLIISFWCFEQYQVELHDGFARRIQTLEHLLASRDSDQFFGAPLRPRLRYSRILDLRLVHPPSPAIAVYLVHLNLRRQRNILAWVILRAHNVFYVFLALLVLGALVSASWPTRQGPNMTELNGPLQNDGLHVRPIRDAERGANGNSGVPVGGGASTTDASGTDDGADSRVVIPHRGDGEESAPTDAGGQLDAGPSKPSSGANDGVPRPSNVPKGDL